ncbi:TerC family protein [Hymenobacter sp. 15J16-1T3B]|uniref:TerC family protein n=1 Tax=Hymenobacter sp. 15J16-1T3B TaxID=2886941 RepID=UPI001D0FE6E8|nr:TerC family protein [Hymenobacter sp. 15J16-1T3B]MCC3159000.1 TerC family protein [Hymenobacter sp. 15J16-1T3B]
MFDLSAFASAETWISLLTLTFMEIVLGIDNIIFISIVVNRLPAEQHARGRTLGLLLALVFRIGLLLSISWIVGLKEPLFHVDVPWADHDFGVTGRDIILFIGGLFLIGKSTTEIHTKLQGEDDAADRPGAATSFAKIMVQIVLIDVVFSFDSILTAVGLVSNVLVMIVAVLLSMGVMLAFARVIADFVNRHPTVKMLALSFLIMIGVMLVAEAFHQEIPKGYVYFAMAFSLGVELLNMRLRKNAEPVHLRQSKLRD